ncbi:MAG: D-cysteine desulfhydrase family protein [Kibdelosporangium sp.]
MPIDLSGQPRVRLGEWPTPLEDCPRLTAALGGPRILVKRDDVNTLGVGGNKLRKLEFLLGAALAAGVHTVITFGALQTNHGRQTAAACAKLGLRCELVLGKGVPRADETYEQSGNMLLDHLYGATVHVCEQDEVGEVYDRVVAAANSEGRKTATFPVGGSNGVGVLGYVAAVAELRAQLAEREIEADRIVLAVGSAGTIAGVAAGISLSEWPIVVDGGCVSHTVAESMADIHRLVGAAGEVLGTEIGPLDFVTLTDRAVGPGYGIPTARMWQALRLFASTEGITLDPVYSGKAAAALVDKVRTGEIGPRETVVFLHTGGLPGLFAYAPELYPASV